MFLPEKVGKLSTPMLFVFVGSKLLVGLGLGVVLASSLAGYGWPILVAGIVLSVIAGVKILSL